MRVLRGQRVRSGWRGTAGSYMGGDTRACPCYAAGVEFLKEELEDVDLHAEVRRFYEEVVRRAPDQDIRVLAAARARERSEGGREELTRVMRELL